jgi:carbon-monoxide dehydrogenase small subunit
MLAVQAAARSVTTIEGLAQGGAAAPGAGRLRRLPRPAVRLLHAGHDHDLGVPAARRTPTPPTTQIAHALEGNLCRCTGYVNIVESVRQRRAASQGEAA